MEQTTIDNEYVSKLLKNKFEGEILRIYEPDGILTIEFKKEILLSLVKFIKQHEIKIDFLTDICGIHYPYHTQAELGVIYHLHSFSNNFRIRLKTFFSDNNPEIDSLTSIYKSANWQERETFDFYGIRFKGHPNLVRILNDETMKYHPLLKQYHLEDTTRTDKDDAMFGR
ncbi:NADH-quinone oxidoreductase subunit C [Apibacter adventoris]|uniref:NADH-quinone oxidoreductase subunit C n=1 Tax=Apibacter adventoris TaxID=1679466 RepID=UPI001FE2965D|nr:NADH-quinone oxidoreductase subunit C [Apibacter adventoris]